MDRHDGPDGLACGALLRAPLDARVTTDAARPHTPYSTNAVLYGARGRRRSPGANDKSRRSFFMGSKVTLTASDGFKLGGYRAEAQGASKGALVVIQEIFGVNHH